jgi:hypothetical protein
MENISRINAGFHCTQTPVVLFGRIHTQAPPVDHVAPLVMAAPKFWSHLIA